MKENKRGLSPLITTVLLIAIALALAIIILLWARGFVKEAMIKEGMPIEDACKEVSFEASPVDHSGTTDEIIVINTGNINIYAFDVSVETLGKTETIEKRAQDIASGRETSLGKGASGNFSVDFEITNTEGIVLKPVLLGLRGEAEEEYHCKNHPGEVLEI